jgi:hypothetical protein
MTTIERMQEIGDGIERRYVPIAVLAWAWVAIPFGYGVYQLLTKVAQLFSG